MEEMQSALAELQTINGVSIKSGVLGASLTTFCIGGPLQYLVLVQSEKELPAVLECFRRWGQQYRVLGAGSNLLISSAGLSGWVIKLGSGFRYLREAGEEEFEVGGGASLMTLVRDLCSRGLSGLEFAGGIPGSVGGATFMNAGAYGAQMLERILKINYYDNQGKLQIVSPAELAFGYRESRLPRGAVVSSVRLRLKQGDPQRAEKLRAEYLAERKRKQPLNQPSAGSVFKNPAPGKSAGFLIEQTGLKGRRSGGACISPRHANWIVNEQRQATHEDVLCLMRLCHEQVLEKFAIELVPEIELWCERPW